MSFGLRPRAPFQDTYRGFRLLRTHGRVFAFPPFVNAEKLLDDECVPSHPDVFSAATPEEVHTRIDALEAEAEGQSVLESTEQYDLVRRGAAVYGILRSAGPVNLGSTEDRRRAGVVAGKTVEEARAAVQARCAAAPVEFAGWLPVYEWSGDCGRHPQFGHTAAPPPGYRFTCSAPPPRSRPWAPPPPWKKAARAFFVALAGIPMAFVALALAVGGVFGKAPHVRLWDRLRLLAALARFAVGLLRGGAGPFAVAKFVHSRHFLSQMLIAPSRGLVFLTSMPYTYGQNPWIIEIEDPTTLFYPHVQNGLTYDLAVRGSPYFPIVKTLLESDQCKGVVTHMRSTARLVAMLFDSEVVRKKIFYAPLGVKPPARWQRHQGNDDEIHLLFINSWRQVPENFFVRGGLDVLEAFAILRERYPQLRLTLRTALPPLDDHYHRIIESGGVRVIGRFMPAEEMAALHADSHIFLLPAARIHVVSLLQAMSYGLAVVASDGWGMEEYVDHPRNGLVVKGRYGKTSWADEEAGILREDYEAMYTPDPKVVQGLVEAVSRLVEDRDLRVRLGRAARADVEMKYNVARWNEALKDVFDRARPDGCGAEEAERPHRPVVTKAAG